MPQIGWFEILIIIIVAILVIGPKEFPVVLNKLGSWIGSIKRYFTDVQKNMNQITTLEDNTKKRNQMIRNKKIDTENTFTSHLTELRSRLIKTFVFYYFFN